MNLEGVRYCDDHNYMNVQYAAKRSILRPYHTLYQASVLAFLHSLSLDYATKITYNKDKDIVFVNKPDGIWQDKEYVYEVHHLEQMVPSAVSAFADVGSNKGNGAITSLHCMNTKDYIKVYNDPRYWSDKEEFVSQTRSLRSEVDEEYRGRLFMMQNQPTEEDILTHMKVKQELKEAVAKLGRVEPNGEIKEQWQRDLKESRERLAGAV